jgi:hypothetical protein
MFDCGKNTIVNPRLANKIVLIPVPTKRSAVPAVAFLPRCRISRFGKCCRGGISSGTPCFFFFLRVVSANSGVSLGVDVIDDVVEMRVLRTNHIWSTDRIKNTLLAETFAPFVVKKSACPSRSLV